MGLVADPWKDNWIPRCDGIYRPDDTGLELDVAGPGAYHPNAGRPIPFEIGEPFDVIEVIEDYGCHERDCYFETPLPDGSGLMSGGGAGGMGNLGYLARLDPTGALRWVAPVFLSNPFISVRFEGPNAICLNDWRNHLTLDLTTPALR
ncbi:hypothetical protein [Nocardia seriolae]|uniref:Uncharacterized protein n=2 Tax=Nocardia seriolae TaxID=37332 RepID=A0A0B8NGX1_9NOCA|nr:hypothetical protein [Nocardia seriolae]MTJ61655.1 hypothetical protein [Nocardia seriolae]MTJ76092.1 hypothetical protein [Nocardia seriolae]MTJ86673.1 hypothetical protein [Nocardia seriolae]MTK30668.1 hypothetical protein [Nocardia seriolae]MTK39622.1 hypothetical protein [Nocardia seriolae]